MSTSIHHSNSCVKNGFCRALIGHVVSRRSLTAPFHLYKCPPWSILWASIPCCLSDAPQRLWKLNDTHNQLECKCRRTGSQQLLHSKRADQKGAPSTQPQEMECQEPPGETCEGSSRDSRDGPGRYRIFWRSLEWCLRGASHWTTKIVREGLHGINNLSLVRLYRSTEVKLASHSVLEVEISKSILVCIHWVKWMSWLHVMHVLEEDRQAMGFMLKSSLNPFSLQ